MILKKFSAENFRNVEREEINFSPGVNLLYGDNAQGKTNLLESVFLCTIGRSPRTTKDKDLIEWNSQFAKVNIELTKKVGNSSIELFLFKNQKNNVI